MKYRTLVKVTAAKNCLIFRTISRKRKSPYEFLIQRDELEALENLCDRDVTFSNFHAFAALQRNIPQKTVNIYFVWLSGRAKHLNGWAEEVTIPYEKLIHFARHGVEGEVWNVLSMVETKMPKLVFNAGRNIHAVAKDKRARRKLAKCLRTVSVGRKRSRSSFTMILCRTAFLSRRFGTVSPVSAAD